MEVKQIHGATEDVSQNKLNKSTHANTPTEYEVTCIVNRPRLHPDMPSLSNGDVPFQ